MRTLRILLVALIGCMFTIATAQVAGAWATSQSASASCAGGGSGVSDLLVKVSFTNTEPQGSERVMIVTAETLGKTIELGEVAPGATKSGVIDTGRSFVTDGVVFFNLLWTHGDDQDSREAAYSAIECSDIVTTTTSTSTTTTAAPATTTTVQPTTTTTPVTTTAASPVTTTTIVRAGLIPPETVTCTEAMAATGKCLAFTGPNSYTPWVVVVGLLLFAVGSSILLARKSRQPQADEA